MGSSSGKVWELCFVCAMRQEKGTSASTALNRLKKKRGENQAERTIAVDKPLAPVAAYSEDTTAGFCFFF